MKCRLASLAFLFVALCLCLAPAAGAAVPKPTGQERILSMDVAASISEIGVLTIEERIVFEAAGRDIKRGLVRELPTYWERPDGSRVRLKYYSIVVKRDGELEPRHFEEGSRKLEIYIGSGERLLQPGIHEYNIKYDVSGAVLRKDGVDSLYWNTTGNKWAFTIERSSFKLTLPHQPSGKMDERVIERHYYTGPAGERGEDAALKPDGSMATTKALRPGDGFTVFYSWPTEITKNVKVQEFKGGLAYALIPSFGDLYFFAPTVLLLAFYMFFARRWRGGLKPAQVIPIFDPPPGMLPGDARFAMTGRYDYSAFAADILALVDKKYLFLATVKDESGKDINVLSRYPVPGDEESLGSVRPDEPRPGEQLPPGGDKFYSLLFPGRSDAVEYDAKKPQSGSRVVGDVRIAPGMSLASTCAYLAKEHRQKRTGMFHPAQAVLIVGLALWFFATAVFLGTFRSGDAAAGFAGLLVLPLIPLIMLGIPIVVATKRSMAKGLANKIKFYVFVGIYLAIGGLMTYHMRPVHLIGTLFKEYFGFTSVWGAASPEGGLLSMLIAIGAFALGWVLLPRRSAAGTELYALASGIKMYLKTAEQHRFEALYPPEENMRHFEALLPYALALGVGDTWANSFAAYCRKAGLDDLAQREAAHMVSRSGLSSSISRSVGRSLASSSSSSSRSSGSRSSSGGGSSGGGAGGGGGRGW